MHHVVERQMRGQRDEIMGEELGSGTYGLVENPIESLRTCMEYVWQNADMRQQAMDMLMENEAFTTDVAAALRRGGINLNAAAAAREQLAEIEADRISLLMQLETAKENEKKFREKAIASLSQKRRDEAERLKKEVDQLSRQREELLEQSRALSTENASRLTEFIAGDVYKRQAEKACANVRTMGVALTSCTVPRVGHPSFEIGDDEMEIGMGIHGEPGIRRGKLRPADEIVEDVYKRQSAAS